MPISQYLLPTPRSSGRRLVTVGLLACCLATAHAQQIYPDRPIRLVVPYAAGAAADQLGRLMADQMARDLGQPVIVDNRGGAGGTLGADVVAKAPADGYAIVLGTDASQATNVYLSKRFPYDPVKSFTPIAPAAVNHIVLVVHPSLPVQSVAELIQYAKAHPRELSFGSSGPGSAHHLAGELLNEKAGIDMLHIPYKGGSPAMTDLLGGTLKLLFASMATAKPYIDSGKIRALAVVEAQRFHGLPGVPTVGETVPGYALTSWFAVFGPAGLPASVTARLNGAVNKALALASVREALEKSGMSATGGSPGALAAQLKAELAQRGLLVKAAGIEPE